MTKLIYSNKINTFLILIMIFSLEFLTKMIFEQSLHKINNEYIILNNNLNLLIYIIGICLNYIKN
jgi:hypothetical protein